MKAKLIQDVDGPNPDFDRKKPKHPLSNNPYRVLKAGTVLEGPMCYVHCLGEDPQAVPDDQECTEMVNLTVERLKQEKAMREAQAEAQATKPVPETAAAPAAANTAEAVRPETRRRGS